METLRYAGETELLQALRDGDEAAFTHIVDTFGASMQRVAALYVRDRAVVQEVVRDAVATGGYEAERRWQAEWLGGRLGLEV